jgi:superfamily II DNA or RNA helicase
MSIEDTFKAIRQACSPNMWSRAVELVRLGAVTGVSADEDEVLCRVRSDQHVVALNVSLFPEDEEWDCNCKSKTPCCEHVAAAIIALKRARQEGSDLPGGAEAQTKLLYRFKKDRTQLLLERCISKADGVVEPLTRSVANIASSASDTRRLTPTQQDLAIDRLMGSRLHGPLAGDMLRGVLLALAEGGALVELEGERVRVSSEAIAPVGVVEDDGKGVRVVLEKNPSISELVVPGVVRAGDALHVLAEPDVTGASLERLPSSKSYAPSELARLVTEVLPEMSRRFKIEVKTTRLPKTTRTAKPRIVLDVVQEGGTLSVLATLVYGDPTIARIDAGTLVHLGGDIPVRDEDAERREIRRLREKLNLAPGSRLIVNGDAAAELAARLDEHDGEIRGTTPGRFIQKGALAPSLRVEGGVVAFEFALNDGSGRADGRSVIAAWQAGMSLVPLSDGGWAPLPADFLARHGHKVADLLAHKAASEDGELATQWLPQVGALCDELGLARPPEVERLAPLIDGFEGIPRAELPARLAATLRDYQRQGVDWLCFLRDARLGATLADDMGLGKTLQALCTVRGRTLVVCPRSVVHNWQAEIRRFRPDLRVSVFHGARRSLDDGADITLTTYALMRIDLELLASVRWDTVVLDEAQTIKNPDSQVARAAYRLPGEFRVTLSGTPVENRLEELWSQFQFTNPGLLGGRQYFQDQYATPIAEGRPDAAAALRSKIRPFLLRRLKSEVARELPPRTDMVLHCELGEDERAVYDAIRAATQKEVVERLRAGGSVLAALESLLRLRQAACHSALIPGQTAPSSSKVAELCAALEQAAAEGHKSLVFSQWTSLLDLIEPHLTELGLTYLRLDGSTQDRQAVVDGFQSKSGPPVLLLSLKAGGTGLNLTEADHVFLMDPWWNPAVEDQAADRAHRIGQERPVFVYRLVAKDTVEERILALQEHKRSLADAALGEADRASGLTRDDLLSLLE